MDGTRFDALTKELARTPSRRRVVQSLGGGLAAGVLALVGMGPAEAAGCRRPLSRCGKGKSAACVDTTLDPNNCGGCGIVCDATNGAATCTNGVCGITCSAGYGNCDGNAGNGCETNLTSDNNNCGACGNACGTGTTCVNGTCAAQSTTWGCTAGSMCQSQCPQSSNPYCYCGTTITGEPTCYYAQNGCPGTTCSGDADCGTGNVCVNLNAPCGGCDNYTGGTLGICNPICTS